PGRRTGVQRRARREHETDAARTQVLALLVQLAYRAEKTGENRLMQLRIAGRTAVGAQLQLRDGPAQLAVQLLPLAHAHEREEILTTPLAQLVARERL